MKKILLSSLLGLFSLVAFAQQDIEVTLVSPALNDALANGVPFDYTITVKNNGSTAISLPADSIVNAPLINGGTIGNPPIAWLEDTVIAPGATVTITHSLTLSGPQGQFNWCGWAFLLGVTESDTTNNTDCNDFYFNTNVGADEFSLMVTVDRSYFSNDNYVVNASGVASSKNAKLEIYNLSGILVIESDLEIINNTIEKNVSVGNLPSGIYLAQLSSSNGVISTKKVILR